jgi:hypothetical protein
MFFIHPILNNLIKKAVCIFLIQRLGVILPYQKRKQGFYETGREGGNGPCGVA